MPLRLPPGRRGLLLAALLAPSFLHPGCVGGTNLLTGERQPERTVVSQQAWALDPLEIVSIDVRLTGLGNGTVDATVEWTLASNDVDLYVTAPACTAEMFATERCAFKARSDSPTTKPERVSFDVSGGDSYRFWVVNFGPQRESGTLVVGLTQ